MKDLVRKFSKKIGFFHVIFLTLIVWIVFLCVQFVKIHDISDTLINYAPASALGYFHIDIDKINPADMGNINKNNGFVNLIFEILGKDAEISREDFIKIIPYINKEAALVINANKDNSYGYVLLIKLRKGVDLSEVNNIFHDQGRIENDIYFLTSPDVTPPLIYASGNLSNDEDVRTALSENKNRFAFAYFKKDFLKSLFGKDLFEGVNSEIFAFLFNDDDYYRLVVSKGEKKETIKSDYKGFISDEVFFCAIDFDLPKVFNEDIAYFDPDGLKDFKEIFGDTEIKSELIIREKKHIPNDSDYQANENFTDDQYDYIYFFKNIPHNDELMNFIKSFFSRKMAVKYPVIKEKMLKDGTVINEIVADVNSLINDEVVFEGNEKFFFFRDQDGAHELLFGMLDEKVLLVSNSKNFTQEYFKQTENNIGLDNAAQKQSECLKKKTDHVYPFIYYQKKADISNIDNNNLNNLLLSFHEVMAIDTNQEIVMCFK